MAVVPQLKAGIDREPTDLWLYLAQHAGLPTRLLDWTEGALVALYFAVIQQKAAPRVDVISASIERCVWYDRL